jgi:hypothetical protein
LDITNKKMKTVRNSINRTFLLLVLVFFSSCSAQQKTTTNIKSVVTTRSFVFKAQTAIPLNGRVVQLTSPYDLTVRHDSVISYLPFFGRAYDINPYSTEGGIKFTSTKFDYKVTEGKKGSYEVTITPRDQQDVRQLFLNVFSGGNANLQVLSNNRQPMNFDGYVTAK